MVDSVVCAAVVSDDTGVVVHENGVGSINVHGGRSLAEVFLQGANGFPRLGLVADKVGDGRVSSDATVIAASVGVV